MKAKELRIGNWVLDSNGRQPTQIMPSDFSATICTYLNPIPLTEEWLVRFGFEKIVFDSEDTGYGIEYEIKISHDSKMVVYEDMSFNIESKTLDTHWLALDFDKFNGVHQLQNLYFSLTGKEL